MKKKRRPPKVSVLHIRCGLLEVSIHGLCHRFGVPEEAKKLCELAEQRAAWVLKP